MRCRCRSQTTVQNTRSETPPLFPDAMRSHANWHAACSMQLLLCVVSCFGCGCALGVINLHLHLPLFDFDFNFEPFAMWMYVGHGYVGVCYMCYVCTAAAARPNAKRLSFHVLVHVHVHICICQITRKILTYRA